MVRRRLTLALVMTTVTTFVIPGLTGGGGAGADSEPAGPSRTATASGTGGAVATIDHSATETAMGILRQGGNAFDAVVAGAAVLSVTEPYSCGLGGGGFLLGWVAAERRAVVLDHRETAPAAMAPDSLLDPKTKRPYPHREVVTSGLGVGVPGTVAGWAAVLDGYGTMDLAAVLAPAVEVARSGFVVDKTFREQTENNRERFADFPASRRLFLTDEGKAPSVGTVVRNPDLARTLEVVGAGGPEAFYGGEIGATLVETVRHPPVDPDADRSVRPGAMEAGDLARYEPLWREPVRTSYRGMEVLGVGPPSSGASTVAEALEILEGYNLTGMSRGEALHRILEASRLSYADRAAYLGDPAFVDIPLTGLTSASYAAGRRTLIGERAAKGPVAAGDPYPHEGRRRPEPAQSGDESPEGFSTTHLTVADRYGNIAAYTFTLQDIGGSGITVPGFGFLLNNQLADFYPTPPHANAPAGGKRPRSSMAPTIVLSAGRPVLTVGTPGGATIISTVLSLLVDTIDFGRALPDAIAAPRASQRNARETWAEHVYARSPEGKLLLRFGHRFDLRDEIGAVSGLQFGFDGTVVAATETWRRGGGSAMAESIDEWTPGVPVSRGDS